MNESIDTTLGPQDAADTLLSLAEVADALGAPLGAVRRAARHGRLATVRDDHGEVWVTRSALNEFIPPHLQATVRDLAALLQGQTVRRRRRRRP